MQAEPASGEIELRLENCPRGLVDAYRSAQANCEWHFENSRNSAVTLVLTQSVNYSDKPQISERKFTYYKLASFERIGLSERAQL